MIGEEEKNYIENLFRGKTRRNLSIWQIILAAIAGVLQVILFSIVNDGIALTGMGIWSGLCFGIAGGIGLVTTLSDASRLAIKVLLVMSILAAVFAVALIAVCMPGIRQSYNTSEPGKVSLIDIQRFFLTFLNSCLSGLLVLPPSLDRIH